MKKQLVSVFAAVTMMLAAPSVALAATSGTFYSPSGTTVTDQTSNVTIAVSGDVSSDSGSGYILVESTTGQASNVPADVTPLATFEVTAHGDVEFNELQLVFSVGSRYAGAKATVYIEHDNDDQETREATVAADGTVTITVDRLSTFSIVIDESTIPADGTSAGTTTDTSATAPATDASLLPVLGVTVAATAGAGASVVAIRKRISE